LGLAVDSAEAEGREGFVEELVPVGLVHGVLEVEGFVEFGDLFGWQLGQVLEDVHQQFEGGGFAGRVREDREGDEWEAVFGG
jgi:hypothetical protein